MDLQTIKNLELNDDDFKLIAEAIEFLIRKYTLTPDNITSALKDFTSNIPQVLANEIRAGVMKVHREKHAESEIKKESLQLLQGKMIKLKRLLAEADIMDQVNSSFTPPPRNG